MENIAVQKTIVPCKDFGDAFDSIRKAKEIDQEVYYQVRKHDINANFIIWKENNEVRSKFQGNFFDIINRDSTKTLVQFKKYPDFVRYDCVDELNASILHLVCYFGLSEFVEDFISKKNCRRPGNFSYTPLHYACMNPMNPFSPGDLETVQEVIKVAGSEAFGDRSIHGYFPINYTHNEKVIEYLEQIGLQLQEIPY